MSYKDKPQIKLYKYENSAFVLQAIIDDFQEISFSHNLYEAGDFTITINYNIPNALKFERGLWVQFGNDPYMFGEIITISDSIGEDGKGSQQRIITGKDSRYIFKRRVIKNLNNEENWTMTAKGEICLRELIKAQCGIGTESKRRLPIVNTIPASENAIGDEYSVAESFSNLYDTLVTIATQSKIGWRIRFDGALTLEVFQGLDLSATVQFSTDFDSLANGKFSDSAESYANTIYIGGKGTGSDRDIYEGEQETEGGSPEGLDRYEAFDNQTQMTTESEYEAEALSMLTQYGQTINVSGNGLAKSPYVFKEQYNIGDTITLGFSGKKAIVQILSVTEHWAFGQYGIEFSFGKPRNDLNRQLQLILKQISRASIKTTTTESMKYYTLPTDSQMPSSDVVYDRIGFTGTCASGGSTFRLYLDDEKTGAKTYHVYIKQLSGGKLTLTTGKAGANNLVLDTGTYVSIIYVDAEGNVSCSGMTSTNAIEVGNTQPATSGGVADAIQNVTDIASSLPTDAVLHYSFDEVPDLPDGTAKLKYDNNFTDTTEWAGSATVSVSNGKLVLDATAGQYKYYAISLSANDIIVLKGIATKSATLTVMVRHSGASSDTGLKSVALTQGQYFEIAVVVDATSTNFNLYSPSAWGVAISQLYIGNGSYTTPVIDNANGQNNATNNGGIAVQGVSGKGAYFLNGKYANIGNYNFSDNFSISLWVKPDNNTTGLEGTLLTKGYCLYLRNGSSTTNKILFGLYNSSTSGYINYTNVADLLAVGQNHIVLIKNGTNVYIYINGVKKTITLSAPANMVQNSRELYIGSTSNTRPQSIDDFQIFDRALSDTEVQALYQNRANTPKYYDINNYNLKQIKDITAQSTDFADFQSRMAGLATRSLQLIEPTEDER